MKPWTLTVGEHALATKTVKVPPVQAGMTVKELFETATSAVKLASIVDFNPRFCVDVANRVNLAIIPVFTYVFCTTEEIPVTISFECHSDASNGHEARKIALITMIVSPVIIPSNALSIRASDFSGDHVSFLLELTSFESSGVAELTIVRL